MGMQTNVKIGDSGIYVINEHYEIVYFNNALKKGYPQLQEHEICYKLLRHRETPCPDCPLLVMNKTDSTIHTSLRYNQLFGFWENCTSLRLNWPNEDDCILVATHPINDKSRQIFLNINQKQRYDELVELNPTSNTYRYLYNYETKDDISKEGKIENLIQQFCKEYIYPTEQETFNDFFDIDTLDYRTENMGHVVEDFRILREDNNYHYFSLYLQPVQKSEKEKCYLCYSVNVDDRYIGNIQQSGHRLDSLTSLYNQESFQNLVQDKLKNDTYTEYALMSIDIEHFKLFNEWYGTKEGDKLLKYVANCIQNFVVPKYGYAARMGNDDFICLLPNQYCRIKALETKILEWTQNYDIEFKFLLAVGVYPIEDVTTPLTLMIDRAVMASDFIKGNYFKRVALFRETMRLKLENEQEVLFDVKTGLENHEFDIYFQPQCSARTRKIIGAEILVRWNHPIKGLIMPDRFIPVLESSGFIYKLDYYVWDKACQFLSQRFKDKQPVVPVSVNVSRLDVLQYDLVNVFEDLCRQYNIPKRYLEIEITESAYSDNYALLIQTVSQLRNNGFRVLMDDFGSGYSALNMLKDIEVDILKLDMRFLDMNENSINKGLSVLESSILMAKWLKMGVIAEGVETDEQVIHLLNMNCEYMQGYYFYKPMPQEDFVELLSNVQLVDKRDILVDRMPTLELEDLLKKDITSESMLNNIVGGIAIYELDDEDDISLKSVNDGYYQITGCNPIDLNERAAHIIQQVHDDDKDYMINIFKRAEFMGHMGANGTFRRYRFNGDIMWMHMSAYLLHKESNRRIYYVRIEDYTKQMNKQRELEMVFKAVPGNMVEYRIVSNRIHCRLLNYGLSQQLGYSQNEMEQIVELNDFIVVANEYRDQVRTVFEDCLNWQDEVNLTYPCLNKDGQQVWIHQHIVYYDTEEDTRIYGSICTEIQKKEQF